MNLLEQIKNGEYITDSQILSSDCSTLDVIRAYEERSRKMVAQYKAVVNQNKTLQNDLRQTNEVKEKIKDFLTEMTNQNNRGTRFAYYYTIVDFNDNFIACDSGEWFLNDCEIVKIADELRERFEDEEFTIDDDENIDDILSSISSVYEDDRINEWLQMIVGGVVQRFENEPVSWTDGIFLTEKDAEEYLENASNHHSKDAHTYVDCMCKWGRTSQTENFFENLFEFFEVPLPPNGYYEQKKKLQN